MAQYWEVGRGNREQARGTRGGLVASYPVGLCYHSAIIVPIPLELNPPSSVVLDLPESSRTHTHTHTHTPTCAEPLGVRAHGHGCARMGGCLCGPFAAKDQHQHPPQPINQLSFHQAAFQVLLSLTLTLTLIIPLGLYFIIIIVE